ncbi:MAG: hypothetical protein ACK5L3_13460 [Oscillospiraceae bacterium]
MKKIIAICIGCLIILLSVFLVIFLIGRKNSPEYTANTFLTTLYSEKPSAVVNTISEEDVANYIEEEYANITTENARKMMIANRTIFRSVMYSLQNGTSSITNVSLKKYNTGEGGTWYSYQVTVSYSNGEENTAVTYSGKLELVQDKTWRINKLIEEKPNYTN